MKKRQILAALLATTCAASMAVPTFAAADVSLATEAGTLVEDVTDASGKVTDSAAEKLGNWEVDVTTTIQNAKLKVTLPSTTTVLVNPYRLAVDVDGTESYDTILSPEMAITNASSCSIKVGVKGAVVTKKVVDVSKMQPLNASLEAAAADITVSGDDTIDETIADSSNILTDGKIYATSNGFVVTGKLTKPKYYTKDTTDKDGTVHTAGTLQTAGSFVISGYTVSSDIKVASASFNADTVKTNDLFMVVQGTTESGVYADTLKKTVDAAAAADKVGALVLATKESTGTVLCLGASDGTNDTEGYVRVTGDASTAPTKAWSSLSDKFETNLTFVIDAIANAAPKAPEITGVTAATDITGGTAAVTATSGKTNEYDVKVTGATAANKNDTITFTLEGLDPEDATVAYAYDGTTFVKGSADNKASLNVNLTSSGTTTADVKVTLTNKGKTSTYTLHVSIVIA